MYMRQFMVLNQPLKTANTIIVPNVLNIERELYNSSEKVKIPGFLAMLMQLVELILVFKL